MRREWCDAQPERLPDAAKPRFQRLYDFLAGGKLQVRVLPDAIFGLIHGKAGVITLADGRSTAFLGSVNESLTAWRLNYELLWEDDSEDAVAWVREEFDSLWHSPFAVELADAVVQDIQRLAVRSVIPDLDEWRGQPDPAAAVIESPVYRKEVGLWEHQKHFVKIAFDARPGIGVGSFLLPVGPDEPRRPSADLATADARVACATGRSGAKAGVRSVTASVREARRAVADETYAELRQLAGCCR